MVLFAASLVVISRIFPAPNRYVDGNTLVEKLEDRNRIQREETLLKRVARLEKDVQAANDDSTAWMEKYHDQCIENRALSLKIERTANSLGSRLTYRDLRAQVESSESKRKSLVAELRDLERHLSFNKQRANQKQVRMASKISNLERKGREMLRQGRKRVPNTVQITELEREKAETAILRNSIAQKDRELQATADKVSQLEETSAQNQASFNKSKHDLEEDLIEKNNEIRKLQERAAKDKSQQETRSAQNQTSFDKTERDLEEKLMEKDDEIRKLQGKAADDNATSRASVSDLEQQLGSKTRELEHSNAQLSDKSAELETLERKVAGLEAREAATRSETLAPTPSSLAPAASEGMDVDSATRSETLAPTPSSLAPAASEGMDVDSPEQMQLETQNRLLEEQREQIRGLEQSKSDLTERVQSLEESSQSKIDDLDEEITKLKDINDQLKHGDQDMTDAFDVDAQSSERVDELTKNFNETIDMHRREIAGLERDNEKLRAMAGQNQAFARGGGELPDATIARLRKEKDDVNADLSKAHKLSDNLRRERDQLREAKTKFSHANSELTRSQRENVDELKKLKAEKAALVEECTSLRENVHPGPTNDRKRSAPDDEEGEVIEGPEEKRLKR